MSVCHGGQPGSENWVQPRDFGARWVIQEVLRYAEVIDGLDAVGKFRAHDDLTIDSQDHVLHPSADDS